ncbi:hypothetical protein HDU67_001074, partial [Dinochytrium kinnereticum]
MLAGLHQPKSHGIKTAKVFSVTFVVTVLAALLALFATPAVAERGCDGPYCSLTNHNVGIRCDPWYGFGDGIWECGQGGCSVVKRYLDCHEFDCKLEITGLWERWQDRHILAQALHKLFTNKVRVEAQWECVCGGCGGRFCFDGQDNSTSNSIEEPAPPTTVDIEPIRPNRPACGHGCEAFWMPAYDIHLIPASGLIKGSVESTDQYLRYDLSCKQKPPNGLASICPYSDMVSLAPDGGAVALMGK